MAGPSSSSSWKTPSQAHLNKYNLVPYPKEFEPTDEEKAVMAMYEEVRMYEKEAARIAEQAARDKLAEADAKYKQSLEDANATDSIQQGESTGRTKKSSRKRKRKPQHDDVTGDDLHESEEDSESEHEEEDIYERREAKLAAMRVQLEEAKVTEEELQLAKEEELRDKLLAVNEEADIGPITLKRKKPELSAASSDKEKSSLIANLSAQQTPPHDFSKKFDLKKYQGKVLFPESSAQDTTAVPAKWSPPEDASHPSENAKVIQLEDFDASLAARGKGNNTIAIKFMTPNDANRFSINIAGPEHSDFMDVLFHFNPRHFERGGQVVVNDKQEGMWGRGINVPLSQVPLIFGQTSCTLIIQINGEGFDVFVEEQHVARLEHRTQLPPKVGPLILQFPSTDDYGAPETWTVYKVWWGHKHIMASGDLSGVAGVNTFNTMHPKKLFISGLSRISTEQEVDLRRAELERAFRKYGGDRGVVCTVPTNVTFAFVETDTERQADLALTEMADQYRINRAYRSRYEALQEERAAAEAAAEQGEKQESSEWD